MIPITLTMAAALVAAAGAVFSQETAPVQPRSFAYVLQAEGIGTSQHEAVQLLAKCGRDWIVIDTSFDSGKTGKWTADDIKAIRAGRPDRKVLAYLSIGEAEDYRSYFKREWDADRNGRPDAKAPPWLYDENPDWKGNYKVRYWHEAWQNVILKRLDEIVQADFDGVYLDIVDAFEYFEYDSAQKDLIDRRPNPDTGKTYREDMIAWVRRIATHARQQRRNFLVVPQNGIQLLENAAYMTTIDAIGVEDLFTNGNRLRKHEYTIYNLGALNRTISNRKPVLVIEYGTKPSIVQRSVKGAEENGFVLLVTDRELKTLGQCRISNGESKSTEPAGARDGIPAARDP